MFWRIFKFYFIKKHYDYMQEKVKKILEIIPNSNQLSTIENRYIVACFLKIANNSQMKIINMDYNNRGLIYNSDMIDILINCNNYINNKNYYKNFLRSN